MSVSDKDQAESKTSVWFYHLLHTKLISALPTLLEKTLASNVNAKILMSDEEQLKDLDNKLWTYKNDSWLPHGMDNERIAKEYPILLSLNDDENINNAKFLFLLMGQDSKKIHDFQRVFVIFDSNDQLQLSQARKQWLEYKKLGVDMQYYQQTPNNSWIKK